MGLVNRRRWGARLLCALAVLWLTGPASDATEPDGPFGLRVERLGDPGGPLVVRLTVGPASDVDGAVLSVAAPLVFELRSRTPGAHRVLEPVDTRPGATSLRAALGALDPDSPTSLVFEVLLAPGATGTIEFVVTARNPRGRVLRDAVGLPLPGPSGKGRPRLGAIEFPATVLPARDGS